MCYAAPAGHQDGITHAETRSPRARQEGILCMRHPQGLRHVVVGTVALALGLALVGLIGLRAIPAVHAGQGGPPGPTKFVLKVT